MGDEPSKGIGNIFNQMNEAMELQKQIQRNAGECTTCHKSLMGIQWMAINDDEGNISKLCQDCQIKAAIAYVKNYKKRLGENGN